MSRKDKGIELSPKHGANPSLDMCFWCGKPRGVALIGRIRRKGGDGEAADNDAEAPREICTSIEPCEDCRRKFATGVHFIEVSPDGSRFGDSPRWALGKDNEGRTVYPTGRWAVVRPQALKGEHKAGERFLCDKFVMDRINGIPKEEAGK